MLEGPELAGPAGGERLPRHDFEPRLGAAHGSGGTRSGGSAVAAVVIDQDHRPHTWVILRQQRADALRDAIGFIARRDHYGNARPGGELRRPAFLALGAKPEAAVREREIEPDCHRQRGNNRKHHEG